MITHETATMIIRFYNMQHGCRFRSEPNQEIALQALNMREDSVGVKNYIRESGSPKITFKDCMLNYIAMIEAETKQIADVEVAPVPASPAPAVDVASSLGLLETILAETIARTQGDKIAADIMANVENRVKDFIKSEYGSIERKVTLVLDDGKRVPMEERTHGKFDTVLKFVANNEPVFLTGGAGTGKNVLCQQVAKTLGLDFYFTNAVTQEYKITGFTDAMGVFHESQFYKAFKNGGLFMLDEMDASIPEVLIILNAAIANRYFDFPAPIGYVEAHPDFRVISAGNTFGSGADYEYVGRAQLDMASLDRFAMVKIDYDRDIALTVCDGDEELVDFAWDFRKTAYDNGFRIVVSYRAISRIHKLAQIMDLSEVMTTCLVKGMDKDDLKMICDKLIVRNKYSSAVKSVMRGMR